MSDGDGYLLDLSALADRIRDQLRAELAETIRAEITAATWPEWLSVESAARYLDVPVERRGVSDGAPSP